jgi:ankyrin repeat protein
MIVKILLEKGTDFHEKSSKGETALFMAVKAGYAAIVKLLLEHGESVHLRSNRSSSGITPLCMAVR